MTKQIKLPDDVYNRLKEDADENFRTIGGQITYLMNSNEGASYALKENTKSDLEEVHTNLTQKPRLYQDVLKEITEHDKIVKEADTSNQDPDYWGSITPTQGRDTDSMGGVP